jgi:hypothetical protein
MMKEMIRKLGEYINNYGDPMLTRIYYILCKLCYG